MVPQACNIRQEGGLGAGTGLSPYLPQLGQPRAPAKCGNSHRDLEPGEVPQGPSCHPTPLQSLCSAGSTPVPCTPPGRDRCAFSKERRAALQCALGASPALHSSAVGNRGRFARSVWLPVPRERARGGARTGSMLACQLCPYLAAGRVSRTVSHQVLLAALMYSGTPVAEPVRDRGWQSAWWCGAVSSQVLSRAAAVGPRFGAQHTTGLRTATPTALCT